MKRKYISTSILIIACSFIIIVLFMPLILNVNANKVITDSSKKINVEQVQKTTQSTMILGEKKFVIKNYNGDVAVFDECCKEPLMITEYKVEDLPEEAVIKINNGIPVTGQEELYRILEDFSE